MCLWFTIQIQISSIDRALLAFVQARRASILWALAGFGAEDSSWCHIKCCNSAECNEIYIYNVLKRLCSWTVNHDLGLYWFSDYCLDWFFSDSGVHPKQTGRKKQQFRGNHQIPSFTIYQFHSIPSYIYIWLWINTYRYHF